MRGVSAFSQLVGGLALACSLEPPARPGAGTPGHHGCEVEFYPERLTPLVLSVTARCPELNPTRFVAEPGSGEAPSSYRAMYWAGALVCLMVDVEAQRQSRGKRSLQHALGRLVRAGGDATRVWRLADVIQSVDASLGAPILGPLTRRHLHSGHPVELSRLFAELGVKVSGDQVVLDDDAPLAERRRSITRGQP